MRLDFVLGWPLEHQQNWAARKMEDITDKHVLALHIAGWKIVRQEDESDYGPNDGVPPKWPFGDKHAVCPEWCEDLSANSRSVTSGRN